MKVSYITWQGYESTAYLDDDPGPDGRIYGGVDKYTDELIVAKWDGEKWVEVYGPGPA